MRRRALAGTLPAALALLIAGCGSDGDEPAGAAPGPTASVGTATSAVGAGGDTLRCATTEFSLRRLSERQPATELGTTGAQALADPDVTDLGDLTRWFVVEDSPKKVVIVRHLAKAKKRPVAPSRTHEVVTVESLDARSSQGWSMTARSTCLPRRTFDGIEPADLELDPAKPARPGDRVVHLLVTENGCAGGQPATGRIRVVTLEPAADAVRLVLGVVPRGGTCPSNPATPFALELPEPLGGRALVDAGVYPERRLNAAKARRATR